MKAEDLAPLKFKDFLPICYEDIEPHLIGELNRLRAELSSLPEETNQETLLSLFEKSVNNLNQIDQMEEIESGIDTEEREGLCAALYKMGQLVGLDVSIDFLDEWRDW